MLHALLDMIDPVYQFIHNFGSVEMAAPSSDEVEQEIDSAITTIQGILTGVLVGIAVCVSLFMIMTNLHKLQNPHEKDEVFRGIGRIVGICVIAGALTWILPWAYGLFA